MRALLLIGFCLALIGQAHAQTPAASPAAAVPPAAEAPGPAGRDKRIEHIVIEDRGSRIEETRYGGEAQTITVKPLNSVMPSYEIVPANGARNRPIGERDSASGNSGQRVWKLFGF